MQTNDILRRLRFAVKLNDPAMLEMLRRAGVAMTRETLDSYFRKEGEEGYAECPEGVLSALLDGMILAYRGPRPGSAPAAPTDSGPAPLDNNTVLKKLRIALELKEEDMIAVMKLAGIELSAGELSALFRRKGQKNYMACLDQFLRNFLVGLARFNDLRAGKPEARRGT